MKHPIHIIIDGADRTGKSTVCKILEMGLQIPLIKMPNMKEYIEKGLSEEFSRLFNETIVQFKDYSFIMDRGFTSSLVYSKVFKRTFDLSYIKKIEEELKPKIFIVSGTSFKKDEVYSAYETEMVDLEFCRLAKEKGYPLIINKNKTPDEIANEILDQI